jgi:molybdopterin-biosynthesis enzyme MoeA-like protein
VGVGLVIVGDELLSGKRQDRHLPQIIEKLSARGLDLDWARMVGDDLDRLATCYRETFAGGDIVFSCGGIGGTPDDLTRQAAAQALGLAIERHPEAVALLEAKFGAETYPNRIRMAELPVGARLIPNPVNQIPGFSLRDHHFVPGFPKMAWPMIDWVLDTQYPGLAGEPRGERALRVMATPESALIPLMEALMASHPEVKPYSLPSSARDGEIELGIKGPTRELDAVYIELTAALTAAGHPWRPQD